MKSKYHSTNPQQRTHFYLPALNFTLNLLELNFTTTLQPSTPSGSYGFEPTTTRSYSGNLNHSTTEQITSTDHIIVLLLPIWADDVIKMRTFSQPKRQLYNLGGQRIEPGTYRTKAASHAAQPLGQSRSTTTYLFRCFVPRPTMKLKLQLFLNQRDNSTT